MGNRRADYLVGVNRADPEDEDKAGDAAAADQGMASQPVEEVGRVVADEINGGVEDQCTHSPLRVFQPFIYSIDLPYRPRDRPREDFSFLPAYFRPTCQSGKTGIRG
jgi:hypothetical protein